MSDLLIEISKEATEKLNAAIAEKKAKIAAFRLEWKTARVQFKKELLDEVRELKELERELRKHTPKRARKQRDSSITVNVANMLSDGVERSIDELHAILQGNRVSIQQALNRLIHKGDVERRVKEPVETGSKRKIFVYRRHDSETHQESAA